MGRVKPLEAILYGAVAGAIGSLTHSLFFRATRKIAPRRPGDPPTQVLARRVIEGVSHHPLTESGKRAGGKVVAYTYGTLWGMIYGLAREAFPAIGTWPGTAAYGTVVFGISNDLLLPAFKLSEWPTKVPPRAHIYALASHLAYGAAVCSAYEALRARPWLTSLSALATWRRVRALPAPIRPAARPVLRLAAGARRLRHRMSERMAT
jgi:hypothetical protein